jgi:hypothetical protein
MEKTRRQEFVLIERFIKSEKYILIYHSLLFNNSDTNNWAKRVEK